MEQLGLYSLLNLVKLHEQNIKIGVLRNEVTSFNRLLHVVSQAFECYQRRELYKFDALVMECFCQGRAGLFLHYQQLPQVDEEVAIGLATVKAAEEALSQIVFPDKWGTLRSVLEANEVDLGVPQRLQAIVLAYLLTVTKKEKAYDTGDSTDVSQLIKLGFSKGQAVNINKQARVALSALTVSFVQECSVELGDAELEEQVSDQFVLHDKSDLACPPCYAASDVLWRTLRKDGVPVVLKVFRYQNGSSTVVDKVTVVFKATNDRYVAWKGVLPSLDTPVWAMEAYCKKEALEPLEEYEHFLKERIEDIYYAYCAEHSQYPNNLVNFEPARNAERDRYKVMALEEGFCKKNPTSCVPYHAYASVLSHELSQ
ncbi:MAG: hypothetical protein Q8K75_00415 [Chlamydiales bacterium]|nr:hypothetical protein [Chlamydiales bacterium]